MKNIFNRHSGENIESVEQLNRLVLKSIIPDMLININQSSYNEIDKINNPLPRAINVNKTIKKSLPSITTLF